MSLKKLLLAKTDSNASSVTSSDLEMGGVRSVSIYEGNRTRVKKWSGHNNNNHAYHYRQKYSSTTCNSSRKRKKDLIVAQEEDYEILGGPIQVYVIKGRGKSFEVVDLAETCLLRGSWGEEPEEERVVQFTDSQGRLLLSMEHTVVGALSASLTLPRHSSTLANLRQVDNSSNSNTSNLPSSPSFTLTSSILFPHANVCTFTQVTTNHTPYFLLASSTAIPLGRLLLLSPDESILLLSPPQDGPYSSPLLRLTLIASSLLISKRFPLILPPTNPSLISTPMAPAPLPILLTFLLLFLLGLSLVLYTVISIRYKSPPSGGESSPPKFPQSLKSSQVEKGGHQLSA